MAIIKHKLFDEKYFRSDKAHFNKLKVRNCEKAFEIWRATKLDLNEEFRIFTRIIKKIKRSKSIHEIRDEKKREIQNRSLRELRKSIKDFGAAIYSYKEKTDQFLKNYLNLSDKLDNDLHDSIIKNLFWLLPFRLFIGLNTSSKHSGAFQLLAFDIKDKGKDFYIINISEKKDEESIGRLFDGADLVYLAERAIRYINDCEYDIFHHMVRRS